MKHNLWGRWLARMFGRPSRPLARGKRRLAVEPLEERLAPAQDIWLGTTNSNWNTASNWSSGVPVAGEDLIFGSQALATHRSAIDNIPVVNGVIPVYNSIQISASGYTISGLTNATQIGLGGSSPISVGQNLGTETVSLNLELSPSGGLGQAITVSSSSDLILSGALSGNALASTLSQAEQTVTVSGSGTLELHGNNSGFTGSFTIGAPNNTAVVVITNADALGLGATVLGASGAGITTVESGSQLQVNGVGATAIPARLKVNGAGPNSTGVVFNTAGNNTWSGAIEMDSNTSFGAVAGTSLDVTGTITDLGAGNALSKEGDGQVILAAANSYRGQTTVDDGELTVENPNALGNSATFQGTTVVNYNVQKKIAGTLQLDYVGSGTGLTVANELLTLNGPGFNNQGALENVQGNNTWTGNVTLGSATNGSNVQIGVDTVGSGTHVTATNLLLSGVVQDPSDVVAGTYGPFTLTKISGGRLVLTNSNTYTGATTVAAGSLNVEDSQALGQVGSAGAVTVDSGAVLELELQTDDLDGLVPTPVKDSVTKTLTGMTFADAVTLIGGAVATAGTLHSISGVNVWAGPPGAKGATQTGIYLDGVGDVGVDPQPSSSDSTSYFTTDYSLTVTSVIADAPNTSDNTLAKIDNGQLILPGSNTYTGPTDVNAGWVTVENSTALGPQNADLSQPDQQYTTIAANASVQLKPLTAGTSLDIANNFYVTGAGLTTTSTNFGLITEGAIENIDGANTLSGILQFDGQQDIGVEQVFPLGGKDTTPSQLTLTGYLWDYTNPSTGAVTPGGITKVGSQRLILQGQGTYTGAVNVDEGALLLQSNNGLGAGGSTTTVAAGASTVIDLDLTGATAGTTTFTLKLSGTSTSGTVSGTTAAIAYTGVATVDEAAIASALTKVIGTSGDVTVGQTSAGHFVITFGGTLATFAQSLTATVTGGGSATTPTQTQGGGAALELGSTVTTQDGGVAAGLGVWNEQLVLDGAGDPALGDTTPLHLLAASSTTYGPYNDPIIPTDALWNGGVSLDANTTIQVDQLTSSPGSTAAPVSSRLIINGVVDDNANASADGSSLTLTGGGGLELTGADTYRGTTYVTQGVLTAENSQALGGPGLSPVQTVGLTAATANTTRFTLSFNGYTTAPILYTGVQATDVAAIAAALNALPSIGGGDVGGTAGVTQIGTGVWSVTLGGSLTGFAAPNLSGVVTTGPGALSEAQTLTVAQASSGSTQFTLSYNGATTGKITYLGSPTDATDIQGVLNNLPTVANTATVIETATGVFQIILGGVNAGFNQPLITATKAAGPGTTVVTLGTQGAGGTVVSGGASLQLAGGITVAGEPLEVTGTGNTTSSDIPTQWFAVGPAPVDGGQTAGDEPVTGRVTGVAVDPFDSNVIYIATAGGGAWKTIDGGQTWRPIFDAVPDVQSVTVTGNSGTFTLTYTYTDAAGNTETASTSALPVGDTAADVQNQLNAVISAETSGAFVTVTLNGNTYTITFQGSLAGTEVTQLTAAVTGSAKATTAIVENGLDPNFALFVGAITVDPSDANVVYLGTGETDNSADSFYGTGIYESTDGGMSWSLLTGPTYVDAALQTGVTNPFFGKGISQIIAQADGTLYVADGDGGIGQNQVEALQFNGFPQLADTFTISFTGADSTGAVVTDTTPTLTYFNGTGLTFTDPGTGIVYTGNAATADEIQYYLDQFTNIGGVNAFVIVTVVQTGGGGRRGPRQTFFDIEFEGSLSLTTVATVTPLPAPGVSPPTIGVNVPKVGGPDTVVNGTSGDPGVWRYAGGDWVNLTSVVSSARSSFVSTNSNDTLYGPSGTFAVPGFPDTPGPDDDYRISFPQTDATWTSLALVENVFGQTILYASLGTARGTSSNGVFWTPDPAGGAAGVVWYAGDPYNSTPALTPDVETSGEFPTSAGGDEENGDIKISAISSDGFGGIENINSSGDVTVPNNLGDVTIYAATANPNGTLQSIYISENGGVTWSASAAIPNSAGTSYLGTKGFYDNAILAVPDSTTVYVGGTASDFATQAGQIYESTDGGGTWNDISVLNGAGPHTSQHAIALAPDGNLIFGSDGGVWELNNSTGVPAWQDINGDLDVSQINSLSSSANGLNSIFAAVGTNGTAEYTGGTVWQEIDDNAGGEMGGTQVFGPYYMASTNSNLLYSVQEQLEDLAVVRTSTDGGATWSTVFTSQSTVVPLAVDSINPEHIVVGGGTTGELLESTNGGATFTNLFSATAPPLTSVTAVALPEYQGTFVADSNFPDVTDQGPSSYDPNTIYATDGTTVVVTKDDGQAWEDISTGTNIDQLGSINELVVDPTNRDTVYAVRSAFSGSGVDSIYEYTDAVGDWTPIGIANGLPNVPVWSLVIDPRNGNLFAGTDLGVYELAGGSGTWQKFGDGLPNVQVRALSLNETTNVLLAGTDGRGAYELFLDAAETSANPVTGPVAALSGSDFWTGPVVLVGGSGTVNGVSYTNAVVLGADGTQNLPDGLSAAQLEIDGTISDLTVNSNPTLLKLGDGDVVFTGANVYGGTTVVLQGALVADDVSALGGTGGGTTVDSGAALDVASNLDAEPITLFGDGISFDGHNTGALRNTSGANTLLGNVTLDAAGSTSGTITLGADSGSQLTIAGVVSGGQTGFNLVKEGAGTLALASQDSYTGLTAVYQGVLELQNSNAIDDASGAEVLDGGQVELDSPAGGPGVAVNAPLILSGTGVVGAGSQLGALFNLGGNNAWMGNIILTALAGFEPPTLTAGDVALGAASGTTLTLGGVVSDGSVTVTNAGSTQTLGGEPTGLRAVGPGVVVLQKPNTYRGATYVTGGALDVQNPTALGSRNAALPEIVQIATDSANTASTSGPTGTFTVGLGGETTTETWGETAGTLQADLQALLTAEGSKAAGNLTVALAPSGNNPGVIGGQSEYVYTVTLAGSLAKLDLAITATGGNGTVASASTVADGGIDVEVQGGAELQLDGSQQGGALTVTGRTLTLNGPGVGSDGALHNVNGNNTWAGPVVQATDSSVGADGGTSLTLGGTVSTGNLTVNPVPSASTLVDEGTVIFPNATGYSQTQTIVTGGSAQVDGVIGNVTLNGGTLSGSGASPLATVGAVVTGAGGTIDPGDNFLGEGVGTLNAKGNVTLNSTDQLFIDLGSTATANDNDVLGVTSGALALGNATLSGLVDPSVAVGDSFTILQTDYDTTKADAITGVFANLGQSVTPPTNPDAGGNTAYAASIAYLTSPTLGNAEFQVDYYPDQVTLTRVLPGTTLSLASSLSAPVYSQDEQIVATVTPDAGAEFPPTAGGASAGNVTFTLSGSVQTTSVEVPVDPTTGTATFDPANTVVGILPVGSYKVSAVYDGGTDSLGNPIFNAPPQGNLSFSVGQAPTKTTLTAAPSGNTTPTYGQDVTLTATVVSTAANPLLPAADGVVSPSGTVTFYDGSGASRVTLGTANLNGNDVATLDTLPLGIYLAAGSHSFTAVYNADGVVPVTSNPYASSLSAGVPVRVSQDATTTSLTASLSTAVYGQPVTLTAVVAAKSPGSGTPTGTVTFKLGNALLGSGVLSTNNATGQDMATYTTTTNQLPVGANQTISVSYGGDTNFTSSVGATPLTVTTDSTSVAVSSSVASPPGAAYGQSVTFTATVAANAPGGGTPTGVVTFKDTTTGVTLGNGTLTPSAGGATASFGTTLGQLPLGNNTIVAVYAGDSHFTGNSTLLAPAQLVVQDGSSTAVTSSASPSVYGQAVTFTATVSAAAPGAGNPTGNVTFSFGNTTATVPLTTVSGVTRATYTTSAFGLSLGNDTITANYAGGTGANFTNSSATFTQTVNQAATTTLVTASPTGGLVYGQSVTLTATVSAKSPGTGAPTGNVTFTDPDGDVLGGGNATLSTNPLTGVTTASVVTTLAVGANQTISASYNGDPDFLGSAGTVRQSVSQDAVTVAVTTSASPAVYGEPVTYTATITPKAPGSATPAAPTGVVTFTDPALTGNITLGNAVLSTNPATGVTTATFTTTDFQLPLGNQTVTATYGGDLNFTGASAAVPEKVTQDGATVALGASANPSVVGQAVTFTATVAAASPGNGNPTGNVTFTDVTATGNVTLGKGNLTLSAGAETAAITTSALPLGNQTIIATYSGDTNFTAANTTLSQSVTPTMTSTTVTEAGNPTVYGQPETFTAVVQVVGAGSGTPTGVVVFTDTTTGVTLGSGNLTVSGGVATATLTTGAFALLGGTNQTITAAYAGTSNFAGSSGNTTLSVKPASSGAGIYSSLSTGVVGQDDTLTAVVTGLSGGASPTGTVDFYDGTNYLGNATLSTSAGQAMASLVTGLAGPTGTHDFQAVYEGDGNYGTSTSSFTPVSVAATGAAVATTSLAPPTPTGPTAYGTPVTLTATVVALNPANGTPTGSVTFEDISTGTVLGVSVLSGGSASLTVSTLQPLAGGAAHYIEAVYSGDAVFAGGNHSAPVTQVVVTTGPGTTSSTLTANLTNSVYGQSVTFTTTVAASGLYAGLTPTGTVTFTDLTTNVTLGTIGLSSGTASLSVSSLAVGTHKIMAAYSGDTNFAPVPSTTPVQAAPVLSYQVNLSPTATTLRTSASSVGYGSPVTFTATVTPTGNGAGVPGGTVSFYAGSVSAANLLDTAQVNAGLASYTESGLGISSYNIIAVYNGDKNFQASTSAGVGLTVTAATTTTSNLTVSTTTGNTPVTFTASVASAMGAVGAGVVVFSVDGQEVGQGTLNALGQASFLYGNGVTLGQHTITATYQGASVYAASSASAPVTFTIGGRGS
jgi:autotransporter-associated beta strand protein